MAIAADMREAKVVERVSPALRPWENMLQRSRAALIWMAAVKHHRAAANPAVVAIARAYVFDASLPALLLEHPGGLPPISLPILRVRHAASMRTKSCV